LNAAKPTGGQAKAEIPCVQGTEEARQELYRVVMRADSAEAKPLDEDDMLLGDGEVVAMAVKECCLVLLCGGTFAEDRVLLSEEGAVATQTEDKKDALITTGVELTEGKHYWEVELLSAAVGSIFIGISRPNLDPAGDYIERDCADGWFMVCF
jgi:hypothetical protein